MLPLTLRPCLRSCEYIDMIIYFSLNLESRNLEHGARKCQEARVLFKLGLWGTIFTTSK